MGLVVERTVVKVGGDVYVGLGVVVMVGWYWMTVVGLDLPKLQCLCLCRPCSNDKVCRLYLTKQLTEVFVVFGFDNGLLWGCQTGLRYSRNCWLMVIPLLLFVRFPQVLHGR